MNKHIKILILSIIISNSIIPVAQSQGLNNFPCWCDSLSFNQILDRISKQDSSYGMVIEFSNVDSLNKIVDIKLNFHFSKKAIKALQADIAKTDTTNAKNKVYIKDKNDRFNTTFIFKNVKLHWNNPSCSYITKDTLIFHKLNKEIINRKISGVFEFYIDKCNNVFNLNFNTNSDYWYFFSYRYKISTFYSLLTTISSNSEFSIGIRIDMQKHKTRIKNRHNQAFYYWLGTTVEKDRFLKKIGLLKEY